MIPLRTTRRGALRVLGIGAAGGALALSAGPAALARGAFIGRGTQAQAEDVDPVLAELGAQIQDLMARYRVPGVAAGVRINGRDYASGWGITNVEYPMPVDSGTVFQVGSTTKTFTGTAAAIFVERGLLDFEAPVRKYVPDLLMADSSVAERITPRHLVTHTSGFFGEFPPDGGRNDDGLARMVPQLLNLPQVSPLGRFFGYNNTAVSLEGRVVEAVGGQPYRDLIQQMLLKPLGFTRSSFFTDDIVNYPVAAGHFTGPTGQQVERPFGSGIFTPSVAPAGGLFSTVNDLLRWAAFQLGDGRAADGTRIMAAETLASTHRLLGPGGALGPEDLDGVGINWLLRRVGGSRVVEHGGTTVTHRSQLLLVPERDFAFVLLTNAPGGGLLRQYLTSWVLDHFLGLRDTPRGAIAVPQADLAEYTADYGVSSIGRMVRIAATPQGVAVQFFGQDGLVQPTYNALTFYARDRAAISGGDNDGDLLDFLRSDDGRVSWVRSRGHVYGATVTSET